MTARIATGVWTGGATTGSTSALAHAGDGAWNPFDAGTELDITAANATATNNLSSGNNPASCGVRSQISQSAGKRYFELTGPLTNDDCHLGLAIAGWDET